MSQQISSIIPLNSQDFIQLMHASGGGFQPLHYDLTHPTIHESKLVVDTSSLNSDTLDVNIHSDSIEIIADYTLDFLISDERSLNLSCPINEHIPLPDGCNPHQINVEHTNSSLIFTIHHDC